MASRWGRLLEFLQRVMRGLQYATLVLSTFLVAAWMITPLREFLQQWLLFDERTVLSVIALALSLVLGSLIALHRQLGVVSENLARLSHTGQARVIDGGIRNIYEFVWPAVRDVQEKRDRNLKVLGLTLFSAWPMVRSWLETGKPADWRIELRLLQPAAARRHSPVVNPLWPQRAEDTLQDIQAFRALRASQLADQRVSLSVSTYEIAPAVHGFSLGNGALFIAFCHWADGAPHLDEPNQFYEYFPPEDLSHRARSYRKLFENWFERCSTSPRGDVILPRPRAPGATRQAAPSRP